MQQSINGFTQSLAARDGLPLAKQQAYGVLQGALTQQAQLYSYVDDFRYMALACLSCVPIVWMLRRVKGKAIAAE